MRYQITFLQLSVTGEHLARTVFAGIIAILIGLTISTPAHAWVWGV